MFVTVSKVEYRWPPSRQNRWTLGPCTCKTRRHRSLTSRIRNARDATLTTRRAEHASAKNSGTATTRSKSPLSFNQILSLIWWEWSQCHVGRKEQAFLTSKQNFICIPTVPSNLPFVPVLRFLSQLSQLYRSLSVSFCLSLLIPRNDVLRQTGIIPGLTFRVSKRAGYPSFHAYVLLALVDRQEDDANAGFNSRDRERRERVG